MAKRLLHPLVALSLAVGVVGFAAAAYQKPTKGRIPDSAFESGGLNLDDVPDYFPVTARDGGFAGYIRKADCFPASGLRPERVEVFDDTLSKVVGHMVGGRGFVPSGASDSDIPKYGDTVGVMDHWGRYLSGQEDN